MSIQPPSNDLLGFYTNKVFSRANDVYRVSYYLANGNRSLAQSLLQETYKMAVQHYNEFLGEHNIIAVLMYFLWSAQKEREIKLGK